MIVLIGNYDSGGQIPDWESVFLGVFDNEKDLQEAESRFKAQVEGHTYYSIKRIKTILNTYAEVEAMTSIFDEEDSDDEEEE